MKIRKRKSMMTERRRCRTVRGTSGLSFERFEERTLLAGPSVEPTAIIVQLPPAQSTLAPQQAVLVKLDRIASGEGDAVRLSISPLAGSIAASPFSAYLHRADADQIRFELQLTSILTDFFVAETIATTLGAAHSGYVINDQTHEQVFSEGFYHQISGSLDVFRIEIVPKPVTPKIVDLPPIESRKGSATVAQNIEAFGPSQPSGGSNSNASDSKEVNSRIVNTLPGEGEIVRLATSSTLVRVGTSSEPGLLDSRLDFIIARFQLSDRGNSGEVTSAADFSAADTDRHDGALPPKIRRANIVSVASIAPGSEARDPAGAGSGREILRQANGSVFATVTDLEVSLVFEFESIAVDAVHSGAGTSGPALANPKDPVMEQTLIRGAMSDDLTEYHHRIETTIQQAAKRSLATVPAIIVVVGAVWTKVRTSSRGASVPQLRSTRRSAGKPSNRLRR